MFGRFKNRTPPRSELTDEEVERGLQTLIVTGLLSQVMVTFTGGAFLVALALELGASNFAVRLLATFYLARVPEPPMTPAAESYRTAR